MTSHTPSPSTSPLFSTKDFVDDTARVAKEVRARCVAVGGDEDSEKDIVNAARALAGDLRHARAERALTGWEENLIEAVDAASPAPRRGRVATIIVLAIAVLLVVATVVRVAL